MYMRILYVCVHAHVRENVCVNVYMRMCMVIYIFTLFI